MLYQYHRIRIVKVGKDLQDHQDQTPQCPLQSTSGHFFHFFNTPPPPWAAHADNPFREEILPNVQPELPLAHLEAISS